MIEPLLLVGAGGFAREVAQAVHAINSVQPRFQLIGHLDDDERLHGRDVDGVPVIGSIAAVTSYPAARLIVCTGSPSDYFSRKRIVERLRLAPARFATIVHPQASVAMTATIAEGTVLLATAVVTARASIGRHVAVMPGVTITHDDVIGDYATFGAGARLAGGAVVEEGAYVGAGVLVREGRRIGAWSLVGMGAVVLHDVPPAEVWVGCPARRLRSVALPEGLRVAS
jgi:sugar O-acyltransferase (sialic acid O-acetyltransferase NeuD family)